VLCEGFEVCAGPDVRKVEKVIEQSPRQERIGAQTQRSNASRSVTFPPGVAYVDGEFCDIADAKISVLDWGFLRSDATYDVVHVWNGRFFRLNQHLDRFLRSVEKLRMSLPFDRTELVRILRECVNRSGLNQVYVEMICTRGISPTFSRDPRDSENRFIAFAIPFGWIANEEQRRRGLKIVVSKIPRIPPQSVDPTIKNYHWLDLVRGLFEAYDRGSENVVLVDMDGNITEGPGFNVFAVIDGEVVTPDLGILQGITRGAALDICRELGLTTRTQTMSSETLRTADEAFITSTAGGVMSVTQIDGSPVGDGKPGVLTGRIIDLYWKKHEDPAWTTEV
jgi:branched-chain amino acid aminotransferase